MSSTLENKTAVVTGATRGIGRAIAARLCADGASVIGTGTDAGGLAAPGCDYHALDLTVEASVNEFCAWLGETGPDILVNNAGLNINAPFAEIDPDDFTRVQKINATGPMRLMQAVLPAMRKSGWGRIVNIGSIWSKIARPGRASYATSKFGLDGMGAALAAEVAGDGTLVNTVSPGFIDTELTRRTVDEKTLATLIAEVPARRLGQPEEIAALVSWLAGPENTYISGQNIAIDGGFTRV